MRYADMVERCETFSISMQHVSQFTNLATPLVMYELIRTKPNYTINLSCPCATARIENTPFLQPGNHSQQSLLSPCPRSCISSMHTPDLRHNFGSTIDTGTRNILKTLRTLCKLPYRIQRDTSGNIRHVTGVVLCILKIAILLN